MRSQTVELSASVAPLGLVLTIWTGAEGPSDSAGILSLVCDRHPPPAAAASAAAATATNAFVTGTHKHRENPACSVVLVPVFPLSEAEQSSETGPGVERRSHFTWRSTKHLFMAPRAESDGERESERERDRKGRGSENGKREDSPLGLRPMPETVNMAVHGANAP